MKQKASYNKMFFILMFVASMLITTKKTVGQNLKYEIWPEADIWYRLTPTFRISSFASTTRYVETKNRDFTISLQGDYQFGTAKRFYFSRLLDQNRAETLKTWMVRGGYLNGTSLGDKGASYTENMLFAEIHKRLLFKRLILFSQRVRIDNRWMGSKESYSMRLRYRAMFEREFLSGKTSIIPYVSVEPYYDSRFKEINRVRVIGGTTVSWKPRFAFEGNLTYQHDSKAGTTNLLAANAILHLYFETTRVREKAGQK